MAAKPAMPMKRFFRRLFRTLLFLFLLLNVVAFFHAWKFTHFTDGPGQPKRSFELSTTEKIKVLFLGIENPKPKNSALPEQPFQTVEIESTETLEAWFVPADSARGTVVLFHGYRGEKSQLLDRSGELHGMGFNTLLVDFSGSGGSEGLTTTIGYHEAEQVRDCFDFLQKKGEENIVLFGTSMGAAAVMRALHEYPALDPVAVVLECPFATMYSAVKQRFELMGAPSFPTAALLTFWGGVQHGFWAFGHDPVDYAGSVSEPALLLWGEQDNRVSRRETEAIFENLPAGKKWLKTYPTSGHESYLNDHAVAWREDVSVFLKSVSYPEGVNPGSGD